MELSYKLMIEAIIFFWKHCVLERPKQSVEKKITVGFFCLKTHSMVKIAKKRIGMEDSCEKNLQRNSFLANCRYIAFTLLAEDFSSSAFFGTFWNFWYWFFSELLWAATICAEKHARNRLIITCLPVRCWKTLLSLWKFYRKLTIAPRFVSFLANMKVNGVKFALNLHLKQWLKKVNVLLLSQTCLPRLQNIEKIFLAFLWLLLSRLKRLILRW